MTPKTIRSSSVLLLSKCPQDAQVLGIRKPGLSINYHPSTINFGSAFNFIAASARSLIIVDHRSFPNVATTLAWAERHAGSILANALRPFSVISSLTCPPGTPSLTRTSPSRCNGRRFRNSVVRSIPSQSLNSAMPHSGLACNDLRIGVCVGRRPNRRPSASKHCVIRRDIRRILKQAQFSTDAISNSCFI
jgi:hypothetical protein